MSNRYLASIEKLLKRKLGLLMIKKMNDPRAEMLTISSLNVTPDLQEARIGIALLDRKNDEEEEMLEVMQNAASFLRGELGRTTEIRKIPELHFYIDNSIEKSIKIHSLIEEAVQEDQEAQDS